MMEVAEKYRQTELGLIPSDWEVKKLKEISTLITKGTTPKKFTDNGITYVKIESLAGDEINTEKCLFIDEVTHKTDLKRSILNEGDLLFAIAGATIGKCTIVPKEIIPANTNQALAIIRLKEEENKMYVFYFLKSTLMQKYIVDNIAGGAQPNLNLAQVGNYFFPLPPTLTEQTLIATALSDADALISSLEKLIAKKRNIKQGAMQKLLQPKEGWEVKKLGEICEIIGGGTPSSFIPSFWNGTINWFTPTEIGLSKYTFESVRKITKEGFLNSSGKILPVGTILLTTRAGIGDLSILMCEGCTNQGFQSLIAKEGYNNEYIYYLMGTLKNTLIQNASGSTFLEISPKKIKQIEISIPSLEEQTRIATILSDMDEEITALETKLEKYKKVKLGMMQNLLTGKIRLIVNP